MTKTIHEERREAANGERKIAPRPEEEKEAIAGGKGASARGKRGARPKSANSRVERTRAQAKGEVVVVKWWLW